MCGRAPAVALTSGEPGPVTNRCLSAACLFVHFSEVPRILGFYKQVFLLSWDQTTFGKYLDEPMAASVDYGQRTSCSSL